MEVRIERTIKRLTGNPFPVIPGVPISEHVLFISKRGTRAATKSEVRAFGSTEAKAFLDLIERSPVEPGFAPVVFVFGGLAQLRWIRFGHLSRGGQA